MWKQTAIVGRVLAGTLTIIATLLLLSSCQTTGQNTFQTNAAEQIKKTYMIGHRGAAGLVPENTLAAFSKACEIGVDAVELDVLLTADGKMVVHHDYTLKPDIARTPDGKWLSRPGPAIKDLTLAKLKPTMSVA